MERVGAASGSETERAFPLPDENVSGVSSLVVWAAGTPFTGASLVATTCTIAVAGDRVGVAVVDRERDVAVGGVRRVRAVANLTRLRRVSYSALVPWPRDAQRVRRGVVADRVGAGEAGVVCGEQPRARRPAGR